MLLKHNDARDPPASIIAGNCAMCSTMLLGDPDDGTVQ